ncbi:Uncharacterised protein [Vibrio cholerae]|uniref:Uncharacterized protein n=1 Tax=Vibrio cholerae TaxID=666 RepID=A0A655ZKH4_VIBCL|nr:Uncharacterised protein [Vibrio cholerae]
MRGGFSRCERECVQRVGCRIVGRPTVIIGLDHHFPATLIFDKSGEWQRIERLNTELCYLAFQAKIVGGLSHFHVSEIGVAYP